jgi:4-hydroxy-tetrahydrodipicolinate synthase
MNHPISPPRFITALGTPLMEDDQLHLQGLRAHLDDQMAGGISSFLIAGSMGLMQLLSDRAYEQLARESVKHCAGRCEVLIGAGDTSYARTADRIALLNELKIDGVVVLPPYFLSPSQAELADYYRALAEISRAPIFLYDLPQRTRCKIEQQTVLELSRHPNIRGVKISDETALARQLFDAVEDKSFRVIIAQPDLLDVLLRHGMPEHLDGMFAMAPRWTTEIGRHAAAGRWDQAGQNQRRLIALKGCLIKYGVFPAFTAIMNARRIPGKFAPRPFRVLSDSRREELLAEPIVKELLTQ